MITKQYKGKSIWRTPCKGWPQSDTPLSFPVWNRSIARLPQFEASFWWRGQIQVKMVFWIKRENPALKTECKYQIHTPVWNQDDRMKPIRGHWPKLVIRWLLITAALSKWQLRGDKRYRRTREGYFRLARFKSFTGGCWYPKGWNFLPSPSPSHGSHSEH